MWRTRKPALVTAFVIWLAPGAGHPTVLEFDQARASDGQIVPTASPSNLPPDYGDRATGAFVAVPGGLFTYVQNDEGFTPNVTVEITGGGATPENPRVRLWQSEYGDLVNVVFTLQGAAEMRVRLVADPGFEAALYGFDLAGFPQTDWVISGIEVTAGGRNLFAETDVLVEGNAVGPGRTSFVFDPPLTGPELLLRIDHSNLGPTRQDNIGLDNLRFGQFRPIPMLPHSALLTSGLVAVLFVSLSRRSRACPTTMD